MSVTVHWAAYAGSLKDLDASADSLAVAELAAFEPIPLLKYLIHNRPDLKYLKCYSVLDVCRNTFVVLSPYDMTITVDPVTKFLTVQEFQTYMYNRMCLNHGTTDRGQLVSMPPEIVFYASTDVFAEAMPTQLIDLPKNTAFIPGRFNISKWIRPINWTFELVNDANNVTVKRGDPLFVVRFTTKNDAPVRLERAQSSIKLHKAVKACLQVKDVMPRTPLNSLYIMAEKYLNTFFHK